MTDKYPLYFTFDVESWLANPLNYALVEGDNTGFAEYKSPGVYWIHFCYHSARGREAIKLTERIFTKFSEDCPVRIAIGLIAVENKPARWLLRQCAGFKSLGTVEAEDGLREMFYRTVTKEEK